MKDTIFKWRDIQIEKIKPHLFHRYLSRRQGSTPNVPGHHYHLDEPHSWSEVFLEELAPGFWLQRTMTVKELALRLGFSKVSTFSAWHRKITSANSA